MQAPSAILFTYFGAEYNFLNGKALKKKVWKNENTTKEWKIKNLDEITSRMKGWQLKTFKESYKYKLSNGISLFKKKLQETN